MIIDLHTHSDASDGSLTPDALLRLAEDNNVDVLSITDHDTLAAYERISTTIPHSIQIIHGIEFSTRWAGYGIHVVGLKVDPGNATLQHGIKLQRVAREKRAQSIAARLTKLGIADPLPAVAKLANGAEIGRPHFARHLVNTGVVKDVATAFRKYLGAGKAGDIKSGWASLSDVVAWIIAADGIAVLAHPTKYRLTMTKLKALLDDFVAAGGGAIEVVCGQQEAAVTRRMATLARDFDLAASVGSDFHHPGLAWSRPGHCSKLPSDILKVWDTW